MRIILTLFVILLGLGSKAQNAGVPHNLQPNGQPLFQFSPPAPPPPSSIITTPPLLPVRAMAEWEELQALVITWRSYSAILTEIVRAARLECKVIICCNDQNTVNSATTALASAGVDLSSNVEFVVISSDSVWVRDYGPNCVYANDVDSLYLVDWIYNRHRPLDDVLSEQMATHLNLPVYSTTVAPYQFVNTGGNFMSDGLGTSFSSQLILDENQAGSTFNPIGQDETGINTVLNAFMGIDRSIKMPTLPYDQIHHIDMHMKLIDEQTLLVGQYPDAVADGPQIEANIQYVLANYSSAFGTPYKVVRIPMPPSTTGKYPDHNGDYRTYANAVFVNKTVIVPFYQEKYDTTAQRIWQEALPGYKIVGVNCNASITALGAIHCITKEIGVLDPLHVVHQALECQDNTVTPNGYSIHATLQHRSGIASASVFYTTDLNQPWQSSALQHDLSGEWVGSIPVQPNGSQVYYYIQATANSGKTVVHPLPAPQGWWKFCVQHVVGTNEPAKAELLDVYPNPASAITCIPVSATEKTRGSIMVYNMLGTQIERVFEGDIPAGPSNYFFDAARYAPGTYLIRLTAGNNTLLKKVVVK